MFSHVICFTHVLTRSHPRVTQHVQHISLIPPHERAQHFFSHTCPARTTSSEDGDSSSGDCTTDSGSSMVYTKDTARRPVGKVGSDVATRPAVKGSPARLAPSARARDARRRQRRQRSTGRELVLADAIRVVKKDRDALKESSRHLRALLESRAIRRCAKDLGRAERRRRVDDGSNTPLEPSDYDRFRGDAQDIIKSDPGFNEKIDFQMMQLCNQQ